MLPRNRHSLLEIQPRYPVLGGWNYTFSVGWNQKLSSGGWGKHLPGGSYSVALPFLNAVGNAFAFDEVTATFVLPEGATDVSYSIPFHPDEVTQQTYTSYLDTTGRPSIVIKRAKCSEKHSQLIYVSPAIQAR